MTDTLGAGTRLAERYQIEDVIGRGRSPVYRARDVRLNRDVAVKEVGLATGTTGTTGGADRARALREARSAARVLSPAVVQVYDVVEERSALWLVMELVRAPSLDRLVSERGPLDEARAARVGLGVLDALEVAHAQGVVHRDVRPANVLVADLDDAAIEVPVKLGDFGLAALRDDTSVTAPGAVSGSAAYTAPEQAAGRRAGPAADLWALGAVLYFAVEGAAPFPGDSPKDVAAAVVQGAVRPQQRPGRLSRIIEMLLDTHPERRPDAGRVRAVLRSVVSGTEAADDTVEAPAGPAGAAGAAGAGTATVAAGAGDVDPTAVASGAVGADATRVAGPAAEGAGAGTTGVAVATQVGGGPAVVGPGPHHEPAAAAGRQVAVRPRPPVPYLLAAGAAAAALALVGLAVLRSGGGDDRGPDQTDAPVTTAEVDGSDTPPAQDRVVPPEGDDPPATAPDNGGDGPADVPGTSERDEGPGTTAPDTTTTVTSEDDTTTTSTTAPSTSTPSTGPTTSGTASTTPPGDTTTTVG